MSSSISYETCPHCKSEGALYAELNCRTGEDEQFCMECGYQYSYRLKRDEDHKVITNDIEYDPAYCVLGVGGGAGEKWQKKLSEVPGGYLEILRDWIAYSFFTNQEYEDKLKSIFGEEVPEGYRNVYYIGGEEPETLHLLAKMIDFSRCTEDVLVVKKASYEEICNPGCGVINVCMVSGGGSSSAVAEGTTKEEVLKEVEYIKEMNPTTVKGVYATWFNPETKTLEVLSEIEADEDEESEDGFEDASEVPVSEEDLPF